MNGNFNSVLLETAVDELSKLPGIGRKTALRLALHLLRKEEQAAYSLGEALIRMRRDVRYCPTVPQHHRRAAMPYMFQFPPQSENRLRGRECQRRDHNRIHP